MTKKKILVVDDSRTIRASLKVAAQAQGYVIAEAENGYVAIKAVRDEKPDIIFALPPEERLPAAMQLLGIDFARLSDVAGHA